METTNQPDLVRDLGIKRLFVLRDEVTAQHVFEYVLREFRGDGLDGGTDLYHWGPWQGREAV